jgi:predicted transcriptional regulator
MAAASAHPSMPSRPYKDLVIYGCFVLNRLVADLGIDLYQDGLEAKLDVLLPTQRGMSKEELKREIKSNHFMTDRVIEALQKEGHVTVESIDGRYRIRITRDGILHIRHYNEFYRKIYNEQIRDHYRFTKAPFWLRD